MLLFIGGPEIIIILIIAIMLFGSKKLPEVARNLGKGMNELKKAKNEIKKGLLEGDDDIINEVKDFKKKVDKFKVFENGKSEFLK